MLTTSIAAMASLIPMIIVWVIGVALALSRWRRHPRVSLFALIAFLTLIGVTVIVRAVYIWLPVAMRDHGWSTSEVGTIFTAVGIVSALVNAFAWAFVICAIFGWRGKSQKENLSFPEPPAYGNDPRYQTAPPGFSQR